MFTRQAPLLGQSLFLGGLAPPLASTVQNLLGQCRAPLVHRGPVTIDYTRPDMRLITPDTARYSYPDLSLPQPTKFEPPAPEPDEDPDPPVGPGSPNPGGGDTVNIINNTFLGGSVFPGRYIDVDESGTVSLRHNDIRRHCTFPDGKTPPNVVHSVDFKAAGNQEDYIRLKITEEQNATKFYIDVSELEEITFVTDVELDLDAGKLWVRKGSAYVFGPWYSPGLDTEIDLTVCDEPPPE